MQKMIIIKYAELSTKKENIGFFLHTLKKNIDLKLANIPHQIKYDQGRMFIYSDEYDNVVSNLKEIFGIHEFFVGYSIDANELDKINEALLSIMGEVNFSTFKVETKRSYKAYPLTSPELDIKIGAFVLNNTNLKVDIHNPDTIIYVEIRKNETLLYFHKEKGLGGYPVSSLGKGLLMLSGGIDSPVAGYMAMKRGVQVEAIYFESPPHTSTSAKEKVISLARIISKYNNCEIKLHVINFTKIQETIYKEIPHEYLITIMRRMMYRISALVAYQRNCHVLINGESIGQVASQTLTSMEAINSVIKKPVIRPLACLDKLEIIDISKKIGTYDTSILPYEDCCTIFVPKHPVINPEAVKCEEYEDLIDYNTMIEEAIKEKEIIKITIKNNDFADIL